MHIHALDGCAPAPLAHYLKALGVLRLVAEQADPGARGWWDGERFRLASVLDARALSDFFLSRYAPTPFVAPWNKGSGFFQVDDPGLAPLEGTRAARFAPFKQGIAASRGFLDELSEADARVRAIKAETKQKGSSATQRKALRESADYKQRLAEAERRFKLLKADLIPRARLHWRGPHRQWIDAAMVIDDEGIARFPALLGTGGNDGRLDFTNNFMQRLGEVFDLASPQASPRPEAAGWLAAALWGGPTAGCLPDRAVGQFLPGGAGGANSVNGPDGTSQLNPFDFVFMMEGSLLFTAHAVKRLDTHARQRAAAPFVMAAQAAGYASAGASDESARGEQWMPLWNQPLTLPEARRLLAEGRAQIGHGSATQPLDMARAVARLGTARGIVSFQRYGYIERNGQSNLAVPLGRFVVQPRVSQSVACLDDLAAWMSRLRRAAADKDAPARLALAVRQAGDVAFDAAQHPDEAARWQQLLLALAQVEAVMRTGSGFKAQPVPALRPEWAEAADDGTPEFRLALAFALQARGFRRDGRPVEGVRRHWLPLDRHRPGRFATTGDATAARLEQRPEVVMEGRNGVDDAIAVLQRRLVETGGEALRSFGLRPAPRAHAALSDLGAWLQGNVDADRTLALARALMALDYGLWAEQWARIQAAPRVSIWPDEAWLCIRLACSPWPLPDGRVPPCDPALMRRLAAGDPGSALQLALRRLRAAGVRHGIRVTTASPATARLWAAALAFPITQTTAEHILQRLDNPTAQELQP
ncbi:MAG TPA: type I-U CRISPR-associated protein Csx17 [Rubrivivax sp.]|nr:type I-U CRISPR-associated protein Csx17 [Rubrivivax sp.]HRY87725.1 type I-U CRISPR-associated protein Csx17 [Rubrivivax sp.]